MALRLSAPLPARTLVLVDGEHYPPVVRAAIEELRSGGRTIVGAALLGGSEKLGADVPEYGVDLVVAGLPNPVGVLLEALDRAAPDEVIDLSDEPVLDARTRLLLVAHALHRGVAYRGADFSFEPPPRPRLARKPSVAVIGTGKRTGKTAIAAAAARTLLARGTTPVIVAMGRGGPGEPEVVDPDVVDLSPPALVALADTGRHAASDHLEDARTAGVVTIGTRRCGGGLAGAPSSSTVPAGVALANERPEPFLLLEGSGAAIPPVHADATVCVVPGAADPELVGGYLGPYALLLSDLVVVTLVDVPPPDSSRSRERSIEALEDRVRGVAPGIPILRTILRPYPLASIAQRTVFFATTAPEPVASRGAAHLGSRHHAHVVGWTTHLADRSRLRKELDEADAAEVLVTELKAAAVDVATRVALERGMEVVFCDNRPEPADPGADDEFAAALSAVADLAVERFEMPTPEPLTTT